MGLLALLASLAYHLQRPLAGVVAVDALTSLLTYSRQKGSVNIRALFLHNLSDAFA